MPQPVDRLVPLRLFTILAAALLATAAPAERHVARADLDTLHATLASVDCADARLDDIVEELRHQYRLNIHVAWPRLERAGLRRDQNISLCLQDVSLVTVFDLLTHSLGPTHDPVTWSLADGVIVITTRSHLERMRTVRSYDLSELVRPLADIERNALRQCEHAEHLPISDHLRSDHARSAHPEDLAALITREIRPESWAARGGDATLRVVGHHLIVDHTPATHQEIAALLDVLHDARADTLDLEVRMLRFPAADAAALRAKHAPDFPRLRDRELRELLEWERHETVMFATQTGLNGHPFIFEASRRTPTAAVETPAEGIDLVVLPRGNADADHTRIAVELEWRPAAAIRSPEPEGTELRRLATTFDLPLDRHLVLTVPEILGDAEAAHETWLLLRLREPRRHPEPGDETPLRIAHPGDDP